MDRDVILTKLNAAYFSESRHEKRILEHLGELLEGARLFIDVGASLGQYTFYASRILKRARIVAIEADPLRFEQLARNCELWQRESGNEIEAIHAAVAETAGEISFFTTDSDVSGGLFAHPTSTPGVSWRELRVPCITLDETLAGRAPDLIKIDVEGAEGRVLAGARRLLDEGRGRWLVELHGWEDGAGHGGAEEVYRLFGQLGYRNVDFYGADLFTRQPAPVLARLRGRLRRLARRLRHIQRARLRALALAALLLAAACRQPVGLELSVLTPFDPLLLEVPAPLRVDLEEPDEGRLRLGEGWYVWEREGLLRPLRKLLWCGPEASLDFTAAGQHLDFVATLMPFTHEGSPSQTVQLVLDGAPVGEWQLAPGLEEHRLALPDRAAEPGIHRLTLRFSSAHRREGQGAADALPRSAAFTDLVLVPRTASGASSPSAADPQAPTLTRLATPDDFVFLPLPRGDARLSLRGGTPGAQLRYRIVEAPGAAGPWQRVAVAGASPVEVAIEPSGTLRKLQVGLVTAPSGARRLDVELRAEEPPAAARHRSGPPDILLYTIDTLRASALGAYGAERDTSPHIDALARAGVLFERASSTSSWTIPATRALLTGTHSTEDGPQAPADDAAVPLAARLQRHGYETVAIVESQLVTASYGFDRGFDAFYVADALGRCTNESRSAVWYLWQHLFARRDPDKPLFVYVHTVDPHAPYTPKGEDRRYVTNPLAFLRRFAYHPIVFMREPDAHGPREVATMRGLYDGDVRRNDRSFGALVELLRQLGLYDDSLVVLTSDHGEEFGEHGGFGHGRTLFEEALHVPLIFKKPQGAGAGSRVATLVSGVDVTPTLLDWAGALPSGDNAELDGRSLAYATRGLPEVPVVARVSAHEGDDLPAVSLGAVRSGAIKCIVHPSGRDRFGHPVPPLLAFDLEKDPEELRPLDPAQTETVCRHLVTELLPELPTPDLDSLDAETRAKLKALGYL